MRGKVCHPHLKKPFPGITPAYAGKSYTRTCYAYNVWDHPRVCGEKHPRKLCCELPRGSPPRMRGKETAETVAPSPARITPAYAGKRRVSIRCTAASWDHPRVCGEKYEPARAQGLIMGSPPRMRGKGIFAILALRATGITPAYAGKSRLCRNSYRPEKDHPRVCGEKACATWRGRTALGSPPRMRGKD